MTPYFADAKLGVTIYHGDNREVLPSLPEKSVQLTVTSPPYSLSKGYGATDGNVERLPFAEYIAALTETLQHNFRVTDEDGKCIWNIDDRHVSMADNGINENLGTHAHVLLAAKAAGFAYRDLIIWNKQRAATVAGGAGCMLGSFPYPPNVPILSMFEYILIFQRTGQSRASRVTDEIKEASKMSSDDFKTAASGVWTFSGETAKRGHPCPFPDTVPIRLIRLFSFVGDTVLDPFMGTGTTGEAAKKMGRKFVGIEIEEKHAETAARRLSQMELL